MARAVLIALGLLTIAGTFGWYHVRTTAAWQDYAAGAELSLRLHDASLAARDLREAGRIYLDNPASENEQALRATEGLLRTALASLPSLVRFAPLEAQRTALIGMLDQLDAQLDAVREVQQTIGGSADDGLLGALKSAGAAVQADLSAPAKGTSARAALGKVAQAFEDIRRIETVFLITAGIVDLSPYEDKLAALEGVLDDARLPEARGAKIDTLIGAYRDALQAYGSAVALRTAATTRIDDHLTAIRDRTIALASASPAIPAAASLPVAASGMTLGLALCMLGCFGLGRTLARAQEALPVTTGDGRDPDDSGIVSTLPGLTALEADPEPADSWEPAAAYDHDDDDDDEVSDIPPWEIDAEETPSPVVTAFALPAPAQQEAPAAVAPTPDNVAEALDLPLDTDATPGASAASRQAREQKIDALARGFEDTMAMALASLRTAAGAMNEAVTAVEVTSKNVLGAADKAGETQTGITGTLASIVAVRDALSNNLRDAGERNARATGIADRAKGRSGESAATMATLGSASEKITEVIDAIRNIAGKTNMLALNATIEAARAGVHGRGFAVVAQEVKTLASQSAHATEAIEAEVAAIRAASESAVAAFEDVNTVVDEVTSTAGSVAEALARQEETVGLLSRSIAEAEAMGVDGNGAVAAVAKARHQAQGTGEAVDRLAAILTEEAARIDTEMKSFMQQLRAI